ncbi:MAG: hypothetical protein AB1425_00465 [Actinomycetota bacterium]
MPRILISLSVLLLVAGPVVVFLSGGIFFGVLLFALGVTLLGVHALVEGRDRTVGWVLVFLGVTALLTDVVRALLAP